MIRNNDFKSKATLKAALLVSGILLLAATMGFGQTINLTAGPAGITAPDGSEVPMWGYFCGAAVTGSTATCAPLSGPGSAAAGGQLGAITVISGGSGYTSAPTVAISAPTGSPSAQATAVATIANGQVANVTITNPGAGYVSAPAVTFSGGGGTSAAATAGPAWSPVVITVPYSSTGTSLTINLTNNLSFTPAGAATANIIPTSLTIVGQVGGGLGTPGAYSSSPDHSAAQGNTTWFIANTGAQGVPPAQGPRVQSFATEVEAVSATTTATCSVATTGTVSGCATLSWPLLKPGTYLLESGTHPSIQVPMGLIGMVVVTTAPSGTTAGTAYPAVPATATTAGIPAVQYNAELPLEFSEIDPVQNRAVTVAVNTAGFSETATYGPQFGGSISHITVTDGGSGYTSAPTVVINGGGGTGVSATAFVDTTQGIVTSVVVYNGGKSFTAIPSVSFSGGTSGTPAQGTAELALGTNELGHCGEGMSVISGTAAAACYPPAVNYTPFYFLINGVPFSKGSAAASLFRATAGVAGTPPVPVTTGITGTVLARMVNAGLRMHVPSIVGSQTTGWNGAGGAATVGGFTLIAEDGSPVPGPLTSGTGTAMPAPRVQTDVFMSAGKTYDVMINAPATATTAATLPVFDRELSLSGNSSERDAGMLAYISVNGGMLPVAQGSGVFAVAKANPDSYGAVLFCIAAPCKPYVVSDVSKGVIANDVNVYGVTLSTPPTNGTVTLNTNGTFTYVQNPGTPIADSFGYCANGAAPGSTTLCTTVSLTRANLTSVDINVNNTTYTAETASYLKIAPPGVLSVDSDTGGFPLSVVLSTITTQSGLTLIMDQNGGFTASVSGSGTTCPTGTQAGSNCFEFAYRAEDSQGKISGLGLGVPPVACPLTGNAAGCGHVTLIFPPASNLSVKVVDAQAYSNCAGNSACISGLAAITDYRWIIEEDKTFYVDPNCTTNTGTGTVPPGCPGIVGPSGQSTIPLFATNFHTSHMEYVAQGCTGPLSCESGQTVFNPATGTHVPAACDVGNGACDTTRTQWTAVNPSQVHLDPTKRYYISVLPGDAANPFNTGNVGNGCTPTATTSCPSAGHTMSGAPIPAACNIYTAGCTSTSTAAFAPVTVATLPTPLPTGKLSVIVFEDDFPLNGEQDAGGGIDVLSPNEPGLGSFNLVLWDAYGQLGDVTGQMTYDMFNQPLSNSLAGTIDPATGFDACPISAQATQDPTQAGITGMIVTCPKYESDNKTLSPLAGQAVIANLMPGKFNVQAYPGADRIGRGEEWIQTNTLDGQHAHDSFIRIGEPSYFQEYGPAGYHVSIGFANPAIINARHDAVCAGAYGPVGACNNTITGKVTDERMSRTPDQRLYPSGSRDALAWTQCWVSLGDPDAEDFMFTKCDANGNFSFTGVPGGNWRLTLGDQWNDQIIDGLSTPANVSGGQTLNMGEIAVQQWQSDVYTRTFIDDNKDGIWDNNEIGIPFLNTTVRYRDGEMANNLVTDFNGVANFNETFPLFNWYVVEADTTRYKTTGIHTVYDAGGPADGSAYCAGGTSGSGNAPCGSSTAYNFLANTYEKVPLPADLSVPGAAYCTSADCTAEAAQYATGATFSSSNPLLSTGTAGLSTGRIDPPWVSAEGWTGQIGEGNFIEFAKAPYASCPPACATVTVPSTAKTKATTTQVAENGGIHGHVVYNSTRPFDDPALLTQPPWEPLVPHVTINLYQEGFAADDVTPTLKLVDSTQTSSWDDWAQGFYPNSTAGSGTGAGQKPYLSCPGQGTAASTSAAPDLFFYTLYDQPEYLDYYSSLHNGTSPHQLPYNSEFKCYDAMHIWNQVQPAPYDGMYSFPSVLGIDPNSGKQITPTGVTAGVGPVGTGSFVAASMTGTNCTICVPNPDATDKYRFGTPMLPPGKYVVEVVLPPGYEIEKEEDKNLLIGDNFIAPVTQQFAGLGGSIFIMPDQASVASLYDPSGAGYNPNNAQNATQSMGMSANSQFVVAFVEPVWPCVGEQRIVPDYLSLFPQAQEVAPFAGATRPLCDRKEVNLENQMGAIAKFYIYTSTHIASKFTGVITDDFTSEFDPFAPTFGEKFSPPNMPISTRDYLGNEISRVYSDHFGIFNGLTYSSWDVDPPNITGYSPTMMVQCMNDAGPIPDGKGGWMNDPLYNPAYSDFCYELPYMPGTTTYLDTPVVPTQAFVGAGYNNPDCSYPDATPAIAEVDGDQVGPWVSAAGNTLTITALGDQAVNNFGYAGPSATVNPFNLKTVTRHYGFGTGQGTVTIGGVSANVTGWSDTTISVTVPNGVPNCAIQQQAQYSGSSAQCGELVITAANGQQSVDAVTVTIGGKAPVHVPASGTIQSAIDAAAPGDLIIVDPTCATNTGAAAACSTPSASNIHSAASHTEMLIMWKPVRLQGVGAATTIINANTNPAGKLLDPWRRHINCLFGLTLQGVPYSSGTDSTTSSTNPYPYDPSGGFSCPDTGWNYFTAQPNVPQIDRLPLEATIGWDASLNGNLAELLQEPSLMGAYEGAGITVLAKGLDFHGQAPWNDGTETGAFPPVTTLLTGVVSNPGGAPGSPGSLLLGDNNPLCTDGPAIGTGLPGAGTGSNRFPSNFICNPSSIDGLSITNSSQGGGGIFVHGWAHHLEIANNRIYNNAGTLSGGISVGQGEFALPYIVGGTTNAAPGSCSDGTGLATNQHEPMCLQLQVNVHNNAITANSSIGDELFSATLSGGGGASFCTGNDYYKFNYNWVCGNMSAGEGGGMVHLGEIFNGDIEHNSILFNQSSNPTIPTNGGGIMVQGTPDTDPICPGVPDTDCPPGLSDGTGPGLLINANLIQGNSADSGSGGGIRLQQVNGTEVSTFATQPQYWHLVTITNNIIVNNMAGWDGAGISLQDALNVNIINNTIAHNDTLASSGVLTNSIGTPQSSAPAGNCVNAAGTASCPQSAGLTSTPNSALLTTTFTGLTLTCPADHAGCQNFSNPILYNDVFWQNRSFYVGVGGRGAGNLNQQVLVNLYDGFTNSPAPTQTTTGACSSGTDTYWDLGVRGDLTVSGHESGFTMTPKWSLIAGYGGNNNISGDPLVVNQYCNGSRVPPECTVADGCGGLNGFGVPPGIADSVVPNPVFSLTPSATVDEGNNWINVSWGPLSLTNPSVKGTDGNWGAGLLLGNYAPTASSPVINAVQCTGSPCLPTGEVVPWPATDFFGSPRSDGTSADIGAVEFGGH